MNKYFIKSIALAAWLMANNFELLSTEKTDKNYHIFWFEDSKELQENIDTYYKQDVLQKFVRAQIQLKKLIHSEPKQDY